jgi:hypothetical protein
MLEEQIAWLDDIDTPVLIVRLLPRFDIFLLGYHDREMAVEPRYARRINAGGGILHPTVMVDGRIVGVWKSEQRKGELVVMVEPFESFPPQVVQGLEAEVADLGRFQGMQARLEIELSSSG